MMKDLNKILYLLIIMLGLMSCSMNVPQEGMVHKLYYPDGVLMEIWLTENGQLNGIKRIYTKQGSLKEAIMYKNDKIDGMRNIYHPDGSLWRKEIYDNGKLMSQKEFDEDGYIISE